MVDTAAQPSLVHYLPIATTVLSVAFGWVLAMRYRERGGLHLLWWTLGVVAYGTGTALESAITLFGNSIALNKAWYVAGALFGGYPLAQGSVYLHLRRRTAHWLTALTLPVLIGASILVALSPVVTEALQSHRPSGAILGWTWIRMITPFVNLYAVVFLIGGALLSAVRFARGQTAEDRHRMVGNTLIAIGAILPGIGGGMAKAGMVEALYVGELVGLVLIWMGFYACTSLAWRAATGPASADGGAPALRAS
ncbi:MAG TPA: hypothetical protein VNB06_17175 [Thermoanaerobaculia bacterium]|nr:hypothetical protein [Thermoanaerobaculia bacterium]